MNWMEFWLAQWPGFASGVSASLAAMAIGALLKRAYPSLKEGLRKALAASGRTASKVYTSLGEVYNSFSAISFVAAAKRKLITFAQVVCTLAFYCFWVFLIHYQITHIGKGKRVYNAPDYTLAAPVSGTCYCPTPASSYSAGYRAEPVRRSGLSRSDCPERYGVRSSYPASAAFYPAESVPAPDCPPARKGGKSRRATRPCAVETYSPAPIIDGGSEYGLVSDIR